MRCQQRAAAVPAIMVPAAARRRAERTPSCPSRHSSNMHSSYRTAKRRKPGRDADAPDMPQVPDPPCRRHREVHRRDVIGTRSRIQHPVLASCMDFAAPVVGDPASKVREVPATITRAIGMHALGKMTASRTCIRHRLASGDRQHSGRPFQSLFKPRPRLCGATIDRSSENNGIAGRAQSGCRGSRLPSAARQTSAAYQTFSKWRPIHRELVKVR
jgi:hypothetical protein